MKLSEIIKQVNRDVDDSYPNADITQWINRALDDLTPIAKKEAKQTFTTRPIAIPTDLHEVVQVVLNNNNSYEVLAPVSAIDFTSKGYKVWGDEMSFQNVKDGDIELYYYKQLSHLSNPDDIPGIETPYHDLFIYYAIGQMQFTEEDYDDRPDMLIRYDMRKQEYEAYKKQTNLQSHTIQGVW